MELKEFLLYPTGYRETEAGIIPEDWDVKKLGELASLRTGPFGSSIHKSDYMNNGIPFINPTHIFDGELFPEQSISVSAKTVERLSEFQLKTNDIIIGRRGEMGRCAVIKETQQGWLCGSGSLIIRPNSKIVPEFLQRVISSPYVIAKIEGASVGSTMINLNQAVLFDLWIPYPPLSEQRTIAAALSDVDALLTALDALISKKRLVKQGAMQELLTCKRRLPGFNGEWEPIKLVSECELISKGTTPTTLGKGFQKQGINFVKIESITDDGIILRDKLAYIDDETNRLLKRSQLKVKDILFSIAGALGRTAIITPDMLPANINQALAIIRLKPNSELTHDYLVDYLRSSFIKRHIETINVQAAQANISLENVRDFEIKCPSKKEQNAIVDILSDMDAEIAALETRREKTRLLKQGMMQELLTGRTRLLHS